MAEKFELTDEMKSMIGWESPPWTYEVTTTSVRAFARGVGYTDPVYFDIEAAKKAGYRNLPAPPSYLGTAVFIPGKTDDTFSSPPRLVSGRKARPRGTPRRRDGNGILRYNLRRRHPHGVRPAGGARCEGEQGPGEDARHVQRNDHEKPGGQSRRHPARSGNILLGGRD